MDLNISRLAQNIDKGVGGVVSLMGGLEGWHRRGVCFALGLLSASGFAPIYFIPGFVIGFSLLIWIIDGLDDRHASWKSFFAVGWWFGLGHFMAGLYWIGFAFAVDAATFGWMIPFVSVLLPGAFALFPALSVVVAAKLWTTGASRMVTFALIWCLSEWLRGNILTGFPWNLSGYIWGDNLGITQSVSVLGIYGLSLATLLFAVAPAALSNRSPTSGMGQVLRWLLPLMAFGSFAALGGLGVMRLNDAPRDAHADVVLRVVQPSFGQDEKWKPENRGRIFSTYLTMSAAAPQDPDLGAPTHIIWPESAVPVLLSRDAFALRRIAKMLAPGQVLLVGAPRYEPAPDGPNSPDFFYNSFFVIDDQGEVLASYDKVHLVPFGEVLPFEGLLNRLGVTKLTGGMGSFTPGTGPQVIPDGHGLKVGPLICYEVIFPGEVVGRERPDWLLNVTNDAWYGNTSGPRQHLVQAQFRAVEQGLPLVRSANTGISAVIDGYGREIGRIDLNHASAIDTILPKPVPETFFARFGGFVYWGIILALSIFVFTCRKLS